MSPVVWIDWHLHESLRKLIVSWYKRCQSKFVGEFDIFDKFVALWISFEAWGTYESRQYSIAKMLKWAKSDSAPLKKTFLELLSKDQRFVEDIRSLKALPSINKYQSDKPNGTKTIPIRITKLDNWNEILEVIYQTRNNYLHGHFPPDSQQSKTFVELGFKVLSRVFSDTVKGLQFWN